MYYFIKTPFWAKLVFPGLVWKMPAGYNRIYLTFDDGPHPDITCFILTELKKYNAKATFFCVGENVFKFPSVYKKIQDEGHAIGNHTYNHLNGWRTETDVYLENVEKAQHLIKGKLFRPPYGKFTKQQQRIISSPRFALNSIMWTVLSADFDSNISGQQCLKNMVTQAEDGSIIVMHDSERAWKNLEYALPRALDFFSEKGFSFEAITGIG
ncbi:MAG: polysaccharide deacetylase family protein [Chitinophagaceae bacterium]|nr:polysaccharide deacetylase family protein [Chitinophagaceae bacterium]MBK9959612.1 polysaccharide deacetylase family protein [Chitinophagaceae bacterium]